MKSILLQIAKIAENERISIGALERKIGASKGVLSRAIGNSTDIQAKWLQVIVESYPSYNPEWLITGIGSMLRESKKEDVLVTVEKTKQVNADSGTLSYLVDKIESLSAENALLKKEISYIKKQK